MGQHDDGKFNVDMEQANLQPNRRMVIPDCDAWNTCSELYL
jgi:hypothetical protein